MKIGVAKNNSKAVQQREKVWERGVGGFFLKQSGLMDHWVCDKIQEYSDVPLKNALSVMALCFTFSAKGHVNILSSLTEHSRVQPQYY